jgi:ferrous iron transport protein A
MIQPGHLETILPIDCLHANEEASVVELVGDSCEIHRLAEVGLRVGASVRMVRPGSPCLLALGGNRLSVRLAGNVEVLVAASASVR